MKHRGYTSAWPWVEQAKAVVIGEPVGLAKDRAKRMPRMRTLRKRAERYFARRAAETALDMADKAARR
jgi:hypothetical protein